MGMIGWILAGVGFLLVGIACGQYGTVSANGNNYGSPYTNYFGWSEAGFVLVGVGLLLVGVSKLMIGLGERRSS